MLATELYRNGPPMLGKVGAVLHLGQPSVAVMGATPILYGETSPAGRTIQTVYEPLENKYTLWIL